MTLGDFPIPEINVGNRAGYVAQLLQEGNSANSILRTLSEAGAGMQRQAGLRLVAQVRDTLQRAPQTVALPGNQLPDASQYGTWAMGRGGQYATNVAVYLQDRETGESIRAFFTHVTNDPHTPEEAANAAIASFTDSGGDDRYNQRVAGALPGNMWRTVAFQ